MRKLLKNSGGNGNTGEKSGDASSTDAFLARFLTQVALAAVVVVLGGASQIPVACSQMSAMRYYQPDLYEATQSECMYGILWIIVARVVLPLACLMGWIAATGRTPGEQAMGLKAFRTTVDEEKG